MRICRNRIPFAITGTFFILLALMLLLLPLPWILAAILAAVFHELCHCAAIWLCGGQLQSISVGRCGAVMTTDSMSLGRELFCALAGPIGGLLLLTLTPWIPRTAICAGFHSIYNLLPIYPLDGGRALHCFAELLFPNYAEKICNGITVAALISVCTLAIYGAVWLRLGIVPPIMAALLVFRSKKYLAKKSQTGYNGLNP